MLISIMLITLITWMFIESFEKREENRKAFCISFQSCSPSVDSYFDYLRLEAIHRNVFPKNEAYVWNLRQSLNWIIYF